MSQKWHFKHVLAHKYVDFSFGRYKNFLYSLGMTFYHSIWRDLPSKIDELFKKEFRVIKLRKGDVAYRQGDTPQGLYFIKQGLIGLVILGEASGKEHLVRFFREGQFFGHRSFFAEELHHGTTTALEYTEINFLSKKVIENAVNDYPLLYREIVLTLSRELRRSEMKHVMILENQVLARTAWAVVYLKELHPHHQWTRKEIANFCASTTSTVIKALAVLEDRQLILQDGRKIEILDRQGLIDIKENE